MIFVISIILCTGIHSFGQSYVYESISNDTRWNSKGSPYIILNDIVINEGATLNIDAGTRVLFSAETKMLVYGTLIAKGKKHNKINFSAKDNMSWNGFEFFSSCGQYDTLSSNGCHFHHCNFTGTGDVSTQLIKTRGCDLKISDSKIENCYTAVHSERQAKIYVTNNRFSSCNRPIDVRNTSISDIRGNLFEDCNSLLLGGTSYFYRNDLKKFSNDGRHSGLIIWMIGGGIVHIANNRFENFEGYALKIQKMNKRASLIIKNNKLKNNAINLKLNCSEAGKGNLTVDANSFGLAKKSHLEFFGECSSPDKYYQFLKNYWGKEGISLHQPQLKIGEILEKSPLK